MTHSKGEKRQHPNALKVALFLTCGSGTQKEGPSAGTAGAEVDGRNAEYRHNCHMGTPSTGRP
jgi:hypothetical protein